jgi:protein SCO1/2
MSRSRLFITIGLWAVLLVALNGVVAAYAWQRFHPRIQLDKLFDVPAFSLTNQDKQTVTDQTLHGKVWIADFIFTECAGTCPMMSSKMADLQNRIKNPKVDFVSFSVDPKNDTPPILKQYAARYKADAARWFFLTGTEQQMGEVALGMKMVIEPPHENLPLTHSTQFLLVDAEGKVRGVYDTQDAPPDRSVDQLVKDATALAEGRAQ